MTIETPAIARRNFPSCPMHDCAVPVEAAHGGIDLLELQQLGINPANVADMSSNILPVQHPHSVRDAIARACIEPYPDKHCLRLRDLLAAYLGLDAAHILVGNGCCELIHLVAAHRVRLGEVSLIIAPTFGEYRRAITLSGGIIDEIAASELNEFVVPTIDIAERLQRQCYASVWICNPNNPTGQSIDSDLILRWATEHPRTCFIVDESYIEFSSATKTLVHCQLSNVIVLRSMTKAFALAGLRLGYLVASGDHVASLGRRRIPWSVSSFAQAAGIAVLDELAHYQHAMADLHRNKGQLIDSLLSLGFSPVQSETNFFLCPVSDPSAFRRKLLEKGVLIRDCTSFGISGHVRIAVGDSSVNGRLLQAVSLIERETDGPPAEPLSALADVAPTPHVESYRLAQGKVEPFRDQLHDLFRMRRDVRRFRGDALPKDAVGRWIEAACLAPSVGLSQPWRFVSVASAQRREQVIHEFEQQNAAASGLYDSDTAIEYRRLKLAGLRESPEQIAIFVEPEPEQGRGLGRGTMPESVAYSVVAAIQNFWLAARCEGVGVGWVSILRPNAIRQILDVPDHWQLIAYLCVGYPLHQDVEVPELETCGWERRRELSEHWYEK